MEPFAPNTIINNRKNKTKIKKQETNDTFSENK